MSSKPAVAIYRYEYLRLSETFVVDHIEALARWSPVPIGEILGANGICASNHPVRHFNNTRFRAGRWAQGALFTRAGISLELKRVVKDRNIRLIHAHLLTEGARASCALHHAPASP